MDCTCNHNGRGDNPNCPVCHPKKLYSGRGKPPEFRTHASDRRITGDMPGRIRVGQLLTLFEPIGDQPMTVT